MTDPITFTIINLLCSGNILVALLLLIIACKLVLNMR